MKGSPRLPAPWPSVASGSRLLVDPEAGGGEALAAALGPRGRVPPSWPKISSRRSRLRRRRAPRAFGNVVVLLRDPPSSCFDRSTSSRKTSCWSRRIRQSRQKDTDSTWSEASSGTWADGLARCCSSCARDARRLQPRPGSSLDKPLTPTLPPRGAPKRRPPRRPRSTLSGRLRRRFADGTARADPLAVPSGSTLRYKPRRAALPHVAQPPTSKRRPSVCASSKSAPPRRAAIRRRFASRCAGPTRRGIPRDGYAAPLSRR